MNLCTVPARDRWRCLRPTWLSCEEGARTQPAAATAADGWPALQQQWPACQTQTARRARRRRHHHQGCWLCHYSRFGILLSTNRKDLNFGFWYFLVQNCSWWCVLSTVIVKDSSVDLGGIFRTLKIDLLVWVSWCLILIEKISLKVS